MPIKKETVNWTYDGKEVKSALDLAPKSLAFIYKITLDDGRYYIGRKTVFKPNYTSGKLKGQCKGEYSWKTYCGSSKELLAIIKTGVGYRKEILEFCYSKAETTYLETKMIICSGALTDPNCLNYWIKATVFSKYLKEYS